MGIKSIAGRSVIKFKNLFGYSSSKFDNVIILIGIFLNLNKFIMNINIFNSKSITYKYN